MAGTMALWSEVFEAERGALPTEDQVRACCPHESASAHEGDLLQVIRSYRHNTTQWSLTQGLAERLTEEQQALWTNRKRREYPWVRLACFGLV